MARWYESLSPELQEIRRNFLFHQHGEFSIKSSPREMKHYLECHCNAESPIRMTCALRDYKSRAGLRLFKILGSFVRNPINREVSWSAHRKARDLLLRHLTKFQKQQMRALGGFGVPTRIGDFWIFGNAYDKKAFQKCNVDVQLKHDGNQYGFCIHTSKDFELPSPDIKLAQKVLLESDLESFLTIANITLLGPKKPFEDIVGVNGKFFLDPNESKFLPAPVAVV